MSQLPAIKDRCAVEGLDKLPPKRRRFLEALAECGVVTKAAAATGVSARQVYRWRLREPDFRRCWEALADQVGALIESALVERVLNGVKKPLTFQGEVFGHVVEYPDHVGIALLRGLKADRYRESGGAINVNVNNYGLAILPAEAPSEEEWEKRSLALTEMQNKVARGVLIEGKAERVEGAATIKRG